MKGEERAHEIALNCPHTTREGYACHACILAALARERGEQATEQEEAFEVWSAEVCQHGKSGTHANLKALAECLLSELHALRAQAAAHSASVLEMQKSLLEKDAEIARLREDRDRMEQRIRHWMVTEDVVPRSEKDALVGRLEKVVEAAGWLCLTEFEGLSQRCLHCDGTWTGDGNERHLDGCPVHTYKLALADLDATR